MSKTWIVENAWTCTSCGSTNKGRHTSCEKCGNAKESDEAANERIDPNAVVEDPALLRQAAEGAHWSCQYCAGKQRDIHGNCENCGGAKSDPSEVERPKMDPPRGTVRDASGARSGDSSGGRRAPSRSERARRELPLRDVRREDEAPRALPWYREKRGALGILGVVAFIVLLVWLFTPHELDATVASMKWIHIGRYEERIVKHEEGWGTPGGAFNVSCASKYYGTERCNSYPCNPHPVSYKCNPRQCNCRTSCTNNGNGFSTCRESCSTCYSTCTKTEYSTCWKQCPVYKDWCSYDRYVWVGRGEKTLSGASAATMMWPDLGPIDGDHRLVKTPAYIVHFVDGKEKYSYAPDTSEDFARFEDGQTWLCEKRIVGMFKPLRRK